MMESRPGDADVRNKLLGQVVHLESDSPPAHILPSWSAQSKTSITVEDPSERSPAPKTPAESVQRLPFPMKLHQLLSNAKDLCFEDIISWTPGGKSFTVHDPIGFERHVMPRYFSNQTKFKSFMRQLHLYGFERITKGPNKGSRYHKLFIRHQKELCAKMIIKKVKRCKQNHKAASLDESYDEDSEYDDNSTDSSQVLPNREDTAANLDAPNLMNPTSNQNGISIDMGGGPDFSLDSDPLSNPALSSQHELDELDEAVDTFSFPEFLPQRAISIASSRRIISSKDPAVHYEYFDNLMAEFQKTQNQIQQNFVPPSSFPPSNI